MQADKKSKRHDFASSHAISIVVHLIIKGYLQDTDFNLRIVDKIVIPRLILTKQKLSLQLFQL